MLQMNSRIGGATERAVEKQMRNWELMRAQRLEVPVRKRPAVQAFIAISREAGAGGEHVAQVLAEKLGWPVFDKELLHIMATDDAARERVYASMDERDVGWSEETLRTVLSPFIIKNDYFHQLVATILRLARQGSAVFIGRGADRILPHEVGLRVRLVAPFNLRIQQWAKANRATVVEAEKEVKTLDAVRAKFIQHHFQQSIDEPTNYDLVLNTASFSAERAAEVILSAKEK